MKELSNGVNEKLLPTFSNVRAQANLGRQGLVPQAPGGFGGMPVPVLPSPTAHRSPTACPQLGRKRFTVRLRDLEYFRTTTPNDRPAYLQKAETSRAGVLLG